MTPTFAGSHVYSYKTLDHKGMAVVKRLLGKITTKIEMQTDGAIFQFVHLTMIDGNTAEAYKSIIQGLIALHVR